MTLVERRRKSRDYEVAIVIEEIVVLKKCIELGSFAAEFARVTASIAEHAALAAMYSRLLEDLEDVEKYGPGGGR